MTEEEFNRTLKELDVVLLDVDYDKFETPLDVAKFVITLNKINERMIIEENEELKDLLNRSNLRLAEEQIKNEELKAKIKGFESGDVAWQGDMDMTIKQNLELKAQIKELCSSLDIMNNRESELLAHIEKMKCCQNCKHNENKLEDNEVCWNCERSCAKFGEEIIKDEWEISE